MTIEKAIEYWQFRYDSARNTEYKLWGKDYEDALEMAIKSLEAWEKVKAEIKDLDLGFVDEEYRAGVSYGIMKTTQIINKHLKEVENDG